jgi:membrane protein involved in colicin uptake
MHPNAAFGPAGPMGQPRGVVIVDSEVVPEDRPQQQQQQRPLIDPN